MRRPPRRPLLAAGLLVLLLAPAAQGADAELAHEDGRREGKQSAARTGHVVAFAPGAGKGWIRAVRIHGQRYGGGYDPKQTTFTVAICDDALRPITSFEAPYALFPAGDFQWVDVELPRLIQAPPAFKVVAAFDPTQQRGVYVGWAKATTSASAYGLPGGEERPVEEGRAWMIRALLTPKPPRGAAKEVILARDDGEKAGHQSLGGSGHVIEFARPKGRWWIDSVLLYGQLYGGNYDPRKTLFRLSVTNKAMKALADQTVPYAFFPRKAFGWTEIPIADPFKVASTFRIAVDFDPHQTKGVYLGYAATEESHSFTGRVGAGTSPWAKGEWMVRVRLVSEKPGPRGPLELPGRDPEAYVEDFQFLRRTVRDHFPALEKKGVDWEAVCEDFEPRFAACRDDETHVRNATLLLATLGDMHTGITESEASFHVPGFDGLFGAGMWIAAEGDALVLRALMPDHPLTKTLPAGSLLSEIDGRPARIVHEEVRAGLRRWHGWSSRHFLDARLSFQFFPFGEKSALPARFVTPDGQKATVELPRWGPGGKGLSRIEVTMPHEVEAKGLAVAARLEPYIGYVRILGDMSEDTRAAFFDVLEKVKDVRGLILDCRGMGGGGDDAAWKMAGRFFAHELPFRHDPVLKPSGEWQYTGPLVMLMDEREVSSAETFTWALAETRRAVTVGRPTGGATIIPRPFTVPSGAFSFRLGCRDRESSVLGAKPEGIGTAPDVYVPYDSVLLQRFSDPVLAAGFDLVRVLARQAPRSMVVEMYGGVLGAEPPRVQRSFAEWKNYPKPDKLLYEDLTEGLVDALVEGLAVGLEASANRMPDAVGAGDRLHRLGQVASLLGRTKAYGRAREVVPKLAKERQAQETFHRMLERGWPPDRDDLDDFLAAHAGTRWADAVRAALPDPSRK